ncbi:MAG TPA: bifunctional metallophosphatase/5'-nucleotidase [Bacteroidetes bacterium]|nr:bifunctional metallophosphatase/5'-nucleotidase [Bacteroidota bacterium]
MKNKPRFQQNPFQPIPVSVFFFLLFFLHSCTPLKNGGAATGGSSKAQTNASPEVSFIILQINDVYEISPLEKGKVGGMARVATLRKRLLQESPNVLTVLAGDFLNPSLIGTMKLEGKRIKGRQMVEVMDAIGVDVVAFGNHEFDLKEKELQGRLDESKFVWIATNLLQNEGNKLEPFHKNKNGAKYFLPETFTWKVKDKTGENALNVGFYSACINSTKKDYVYYEDPFQEAIKAYLLLKNESDIILGLTHLSIAQDMKMAALLPGTKLIMGGHEHDNSRDTVGNVVITKADANAKTAYVHRFRYNTRTGQLSFTSELVPITDKMPDDAAIKTLVNKWQKIQDDKIAEVVSNPKEVVFHAEVPLDGREKSMRNGQTNLGNIISKSMAAAAKKKVDCAFFNSGSVRLDDQLSGDITAVDFFRAMPFGGGIYEIDLKGNVLKRALDAGIENKGIGGYLQWDDNIEYNAADRSWKIGGSKLDEGKVYHVATSDYLANGNEKGLEFFNPKNFVAWETAKKGDNADLRSDVRKAVVAFLKNK